MEYNILLMLNMICRRGTYVRIRKAVKLAAEMSPEQSLIINLSGRGDKDMNTIAKIEGIEL